MGTFFVHFSQIFLYLKFMQQFLVFFNFFICFEKMNPKMTSKMAKFFFL